MVYRKYLLKVLNKGIVLFAVAALSSGATYFVCEKNYEDLIADLNQQIDDLKEKELKARVTQRVSEQMEEIATQQTLISNNERDNAEKQSRIADIERGKAEMEKGLAMKAQQEALISAAEAQKERDRAEEQSRLATQNMIIAQQSRAHADTLLYLSLANSLAQSSLAQGQSQSTPLSRLLSYAAWYYSDSYDGDPINQQNIYKALLMSSGSIDETGNSLQGNIRRIRVKDGHVLAVTDYGEVFYAGNIRSSFLLGNYDFRDFISFSNKENIILCADGRILTANLSNIENATTSKDIPLSERVKLPHDTWHHTLLMPDGKTMVVMGKRNIAWVDVSSYSLMAVSPVGNGVTSIGRQKDILHVFCEDGAHYISNDAGNLVLMPFASLGKNENVTAYVYDVKRGYSILGMNDGKIYIYNDNGQKQAELLGHSASITDLHCWNELLGSTCYDNTIRLWNITDLTTTVSPVVMELQQWPLTFDVDKNTYKVWIGTEKGLTPNFCCDIIRNAESTRKHLTREFTTEEWNYYIGRSIEQVKFLK